MNWDSFYPPMFGSFLGVGLGILANHVYQGYISDKNKEKYKRMIKSEIELCINRLENDWVQLLPVDQWSSAVNSGALKLFEVEKEMGPLSTAYQEIRDYNLLIRDWQNIGLTWEYVEENLEEVFDSDGKLCFAQILRYRKSLLATLGILDKAEWLYPSYKPFPVR